MPIYPYCVYVIYFANNGVREKDLGRGLGKEGGQNKGIVIQGK